MRIRIITGPLLTLLIIVSAFFSSAHSQTWQRNLKDYKEGLPLDLKDEFLDVEKTKRQLAPARQFLWDLWKSHTKGYLKRTSYSREGNPAWCTFFVEPDSTGQWRVTLECKASVCPFISSKKCRQYLRTLDRETYDSVERIELGYDVFSHSPPKLPDNDERDPLKFVLILRSSITGKTAQL